MTDSPPTVRFGILGAARIAPMSLVRPAKLVPGVSLDAVAARNADRARRFADQHGIPRVHSSYAALLDDKDLDAVYIPLPNSLHAEWSIRAMRAGKHVLCEKPLASNAAEAEQMLRVAGETGRVLCEGVHYRFHPIADRMREIATSGSLGKQQHVTAELFVPVLFHDDVRYRFDLSGGAMMDVGCYAVNICRFLVGEEPTVTQAEATLASDQVDRRMTAKFQFPSGVTGRINCSICSINLLRTNVTLRGERGELRVFNPYMPQMLCHRLRIRDDRGRRTERVSSEPTFHFQLARFAATVRGERSLPFDPADAVANLRVIDAVYQRAGLKQRGT